jgi:nucleotide-binding universal stress UspA family protein
MKTILVPTDFSTEATRALDAAAVIARKTGASITLLHIVESVLDGSFVTSGTHLPKDSMEYLYMIKRIEHAHQQMNEIISEQLSGIEVNTQVKIGLVYQNIAKAIAEEEVDLIVMGTKGATGLQEMLIGSNTEKVVTYSHSLVLSVGSGSKDFAFRNVVLPTDLSTKSPAFLKRLADLQVVFDFQVHVLYVNTPLNYSTTYQIEDRMAKFLEDCPLKNISTTILDEYSQEDGIIAFAQKTDADLIALLTHGRKGWSYFLDGSVTRTIVNHTTIPVLTYKLAYAKSESHTVQSAISSKQ